MEPISDSRYAGRRVSFRRMLVALAVGGALLAGASGAGATSLVAVHAPGGPGYVRIASLAQDQDVVVSRSVGLMEGATGTTSETDLGAGHVEVSRSVGLMEGASGTATEANLASAPVLVSRSIGLMDGALK